MITLALCTLALQGTVGPLQLQAEWSAPTQLPFERVHAVAQTPSQMVVGGIKGVGLGGPGKWRIAEDRPVREMVAQGSDVWVLYGDGSVDKLQPKEDRLYYDVLKEASKRPWASTLFADKESIYFGTMGGWIVKSKTFAEFHPKELNGQVITAICRINNDLWLGTQRAGVFRVRENKIDRFGFAAGLPDSWVTAITNLDGTPTVGCADGGVSVFKNEKFTPLPTPATKIRKLHTFRGSLVIGALDGAWIQNPNGWQKLTDQETTTISQIDKNLALGTPTGLAIWKP